MLVDELLNTRVQIELIEPPHLRNELVQLYRNARGSLGIDLPQHIVAALEKLGRPLPRREIEEIHFFDLPYLNAFAFAHRDHAFVGMSVATPLLCTGLFMAALSEGALFDGISDVPYLRKSFISRGPADWTALTLLMHAFDIHSFYSWTRTVPGMEQAADRTGRGDLAIVLSMNACFFLFFHEWGHIALKHFDPASADSPAMVHSELNTAINAGEQGGPLSEEGLLWHANEVEADRFAADRLYVGYYREPPYPVPSDLRSELHREMVA